jgi:hypothetical protein
VGTGLGHGALIGHWKLDLAHPLRSITRLFAAEASGRAWPGWQAAGGDAPTGAKGGFFGEGGLHLAAELEHFLPHPTLILGEFLGFVAQPRHLVSQRNLPHQPFEDEWQHGLTSPQFLTQAAGFLPQALNALTGLSGAGQNGVELAEHGVCLDDELAFRHFGVGFAPRKRQGGRLGFHGSSLALRGRRSKAQFMPVPPSSRNPCGR